MKMRDVKALWLWLVLAFGPANQRIWQLSKHYDDIEIFVRALMNNTVRDMTDKEISRVKRTNLGDADKLLKYCGEHGINVCCFDDEDYPEKLRQIANPPAVLFYYGDISIVNRGVHVAVVGTRKPSDYSVSVTEKLCQSMVKRSFVLISGFALGIDQIANRVALENNMPSVAVCAGPLEEDYPKNSKQLKKFIAQNGAVISECYPGYRPFGRFFSNRNRIMVGLSDGVLFCECSADSRGLDNVEYARAYGKAIFVIPPHDIYDSRYFGQRDLIRDGAVPVFDGADVAYNFSYGRYDDLSIIKSLGQFTLPSKDSIMFRSDEKAAKSKSKKRRKKAVPDNDERVTETRVTVDRSGLSEIQQRICNALDERNMLADEIAEHLGVDITTVLSELIELEIDGMVTALPGKMYSI